MKQEVNTNACSSPNPVCQNVFVAAAVSTAIAFTAGCHRDPNVRKQKYLESEHGEASGKNKEAAIQFANALKIDKDYADGYLELAKVNLKWQCHSRLLRTAEGGGPGARQPEARITLGELLRRARATALPRSERGHRAQQSQWLQTLMLFWRVLQNKGDIPEALK